MRCRRRGWRIGVRRVIFIRFRGWEWDLGVGGEGGEGGKVVEVVDGEVGKVVEVVEGGGEQGIIVVEVAEVGSEEAEEDLLEGIV